MDDDSPSVRTHVAKQLKELGENLRPSIANLNQTLTSEQIEILDQIENEYLSEKTLKEWQSIFEIENYFLRLEPVFEKISKYQNNFHYLN